MDYKKLPDTPWHIGYVKKNEDDPRRHKSRCVYNNGDRCNNPYMLRCVSSSHCKYYAEDWETAERFKASMRIDYKGAGVIPVSIGKVLYGEKDKEQLHIKHSASRAYETCPYCEKTIRKSRLKAHMEQRCDKRSKQQSEKADTSRKNKITICFLCKNRYDNNCSITKERIKYMSHCLFFKT